MAFAATACGVSASIANALGAHATEARTARTAETIPLTGDTFTADQPRTVTPTWRDWPVLNGKPDSARTRARKTYFVVRTVRVNR